MMQVQSVQKHTCKMLAVFSGPLKGPLEPEQELQGSETHPVYPFPEIISAGNLEIRSLNDPKPADVHEALDSFHPDIVCFHGEKHQNGAKMGALIWDGMDVSTDIVLGLFDSFLPGTVYLETPDGDELAESLHSKGIPYVIYWKSSFSSFSASHFCHAMFSALQSSTAAHTWDAFKLARASFEFYCKRSNLVLPAAVSEAGCELGPHLLGDSPRINLSPPTYEGAEDNSDASLDPPTLTIYDSDVHTRFLFCGEPRSLDAGSLTCLEDGLSALLNIEIRGSKLHNRVSAPPPPLEAGTVSRGVVTMRCDLSTSSSAYVSLLVSGSAQTCFDDQVLENHIKSEIMETRRAIRAETDSDSVLPEPRRSMAIASGAPVFQVSMKVPTWAAQVMWQLSTDPTYRSFPALGISGFEGFPVASFTALDADRLLFFRRRKSKTSPNLLPRTDPVPDWLDPPPPRPRGFRSAPAPATMRPVPRARRRRVLTPEIGGATARAASVSVGKPRRRLMASAAVMASSSVNPLPLKKHACDRIPIRQCREDEFLKDVMQFLVLRGHSRLIPHAGLADFPDAILNAKRLDLYNLYREVVSRGGFHVGNGINWKGQVFSKMRNYTATNRMTGVGNTLKRHYETYLLEYELAHDDVDGECCLLCHSSAAGDWVNCGTCGEWAHFGCDTRQGLGAFKDYAKTDGLDYICPHCSAVTYKKKMQKVDSALL